MLQWAAAASAAVIEQLLPQDSLQSTAPDATANPVVAASEAAASSSDPFPDNAVSIGSRIIPGQTVGQQSQQQQQQQPGGDDFDVDAAPSALISDSLAISDVVGDLGPVEWCTLGDA